jgi:predicted nucleotidyltransferase
MDKNKQFLKRIKEVITEKAPLAKVYLYGSRVRGTANDESDWDILIILKREKITVEIESEITDPLYDLELDTGEVISPMIYSDLEWNTKYKITPFHSNVMNEAQLL